MSKLSLAKLERHLYGAADILRREGMDAATYKDFIFGMLFLKRCSDVFEAAREKIISGKVATGMIHEEAVEKYGENSDFYDEFFVPSHARWPYLQEKLNDASEHFGAVLDKAIAALSEANEPLQHVLDHVQFMRVQSKKRIVSDEACKDLVRHFSCYRLRKEDFQFSDLLGSAYEFLINMFAETAGKKGGDFYTPRDVIRLMVRILNPSGGMSIYDPTCGSGGMLIISREYLEQSGDDPTNLRLCGQVNDASAWSICKINMLLHGILGADIQLEDTLLHPLHKESGELERFDRVIANPPFSQNYTRSSMEFPERFRWGLCPTSGKKADLMFAQHMLAVCKPDGMVATVMPHGVLFRSGAEKDIRKKFLQEDLIEAIISLPQNLFYGASIPACILIMRPNLTGKTLNPNKPKARRGRVLFINADAEYQVGRAQNYLRPEDIEKIASIFESYNEVHNYSKVVIFEEITNPANDFNLNVRRYVDNSPPSEPHDVHAHLVGGIPATEIQGNQSFFKSLGFSLNAIFARRSDDNRYYDFKANITERADIVSLIESDTGLLTRTDGLREALTTWWISHSGSLVALPSYGNLNMVRTEFLEEFVEALLPFKVLDRFKLSGVVAAWWTETLPDLKTLIENGFSGVVEGWIDAIADAVEDDDNVGPTFDPFSHKLVKRTMVDYLQQINNAKSEIANLKEEKETFEQSNPPDYADDKELSSWNYAKNLEQQIKELKADYREVTTRLKRLERTAGRKKATDVDRHAVKAMQRELQPYFDRMDVLNTELAPYEQIKTALTVARDTFRMLASAFINELKKRCMAMNKDKKQMLVLELFAHDLQSGLDSAVKNKKRELIQLTENFWDKYAAPLAMLIENREHFSLQFHNTLQELGYHSEQVIDSPSGMVKNCPEAWDQVTLYHYGEVVSGGTPNRNNPAYWGGDILWVTPSEITSNTGKYLSSTREKITLIGLHASSAKVLPQNSLLVTSRATLCEVALAGNPISTNQGFKNIVPNKQTDSNFAFHQIKTLKREMTRLASGTTFLEISKGDFSRIPVNRPELPEQARIANVLDFIDETISKTEAELLKLRKIRLGLQDDLLSGRVRVPEDIVG
ncbi:MAG: N-6 DNA methylase [Pseudohongiellaceae bacterium]